MMNMTYLCYIVLLCIWNGHCIWKHHFISIPAPRPTDYWQWLNNVFLPVVNHLLQAFEGYFHMRNHNELNVKIIIADAATLHVY